MSGNTCTMCEGNTDTRCEGNTGIKVTHVSGVSRVGHRGTVEANIVILPDGANEHV